MAKPARTLTVFGKDLDALLERAGKLSIREYADQVGVDYQYISQLRHMSDRHPGKLYVNLLRPFAKLKILSLPEAQQLSLRHRGKPLSLAECKEVFPDLPEPELAESLKQALEHAGEDAPRPSAEAKAVQGATAGGARAPYGSIYRRVFVGRETELRELRSALYSAVSRQGALVMVVGEPGIGKTALWEQLSRQVTSMGVKTLVGHCYEKGSLSLPYLPFVEALRSYVLARDATSLRKELGSGAADLVRIIPEIRDRLSVQPRPAGDPDEERYRLMQSVVDFMGEIAAVQPLLIVLEDLHNADKGTLDMLTYVSRNLAGKKLLLIGTYRDVEVDRTHPLSATLAELRRASSYGRIVLRGLEVGDVRGMLDSITGQETSAGIAEAVHRQTEGNPLFVQEVTRYLVEEKLLGRGAAQTQSRESLELHIPEGLRDVIGKRLSRLGPECNALLSTAAVIGREFPIKVLRAVVGLPDEELNRFLREAKRVAVIEERTSIGGEVTYRFAHAFFRQTLYEEMIAPQRLKLHQQVARALEEIYKARLEEHAAELAEHFSYSSDTADLKKAVSYGEMAAKRAMDVFAYGEAARLLEQAIKVQEILDPEDQAKKCDLLIDLCNALLDVPDTRRIIEVEAPAAFSLAESIGDGSRAVSACITALDAISREQLGPGYATPQYADWTGRLDRYARPDTVERARADFRLGCMKCETRHMPVGAEAPYSSSWPGPSPG